MFGAAMSKSSDTPQQDVRSHPRAPLEVEVSMSSESQFFAGISGNISEGGLFVCTYQRLPLDQPVEVNLVLESGESVVARGHVRWVREATDGSCPGVGIEFDEIDAKAREAIEVFCATRPPMYVDLG
jgi:uncharacterized protein (TIGR02266 family)